MRILLADQTGVTLVRGMSKFKVKKAVLELLDYPGNPQTVEEIYDEANCEEWLFCLSLGDDELLPALVESPSDELISTTKNEYGVSVVDIKRGAVRDHNYTGHGDICYSDAVWGL